jgi:hypothetical protein
MQIPTRRKIRTDLERVYLRRIRTINERERRKINIFKTVVRFMNARDRRTAFHHSEGAAVAAELEQMG